MSDHDFPPDLVDLQRASTAAWDAVEAHRKGVDARRVADADAADEAIRAAGGRVEEVPRWGRRALPPWTDAEDARHAELLAAAKAAAEALRAGIRDAGLDGGYTVTQGLKDAARPPATA